jgi:hypothetical protein
MSENTSPAVKILTEVGYETAASQGNSDTKGLSVPPPPRALMQEGPTVPTLPPQAGISSGQGSGSSPQTSTPSSQPKTPSVDSSNGG